MLISAPIVNQRTQTGNDGQAPEDGNQDCVPAAFSSIIRAFYPSSTITADGLHDAAYRQGYVGMQDPARYAAIASRYGVAMTYVSGSSQYEVNTAVAAIRAGHGVLLTIPSDWGDNPPTSPYSHTVAGCDTNGTSITCMNSWTAAYETYSLAWWAIRLARASYQGIWIVQKVGTTVWTRAADGSAQDSATPVRHSVGAGIASAIFASGKQGTNGLTSEEYYAAGKSFAALDDGTVINWDGAGVHLNQAAQVVAALWSQLQAAQHQPPATDQIAAQALAWVESGKALLGKLP